MAKQKVAKAEVEQATVEAVIKFLKENGAGSVIKRSKVARVTCDFCMPGTCRNDDSLGRGPDERMLFGTRGEVGYPIESLARYMAGRGFVIESKQVAANE